MFATSDLHLGSAFSIWPEGFTGSSGTVLQPNRGQKYLNKEWSGIYREVKEITGGRLDVFCLVGDAVQGKGAKQEGEFIIEPNMAYQGRAALIKIEPFVDMASRGQRYVFRGSRYHVGSQNETEEWIAYTIGAIPDDFGRYCWMWLPDLDIGGQCFDISHHQSATIINRSMPLERERRFNNNMDDMKRRADAIIRGHAHVQVELRVDGELQLGLLPMQMQTDYAQESKFPNRLLSRYLGACLLKINTNPKTYTEPIEVIWLRFKHPPLSRRTYERSNEPWRMDLRNLISQLET
jgi:hypothetical protein